MNARVSLALLAALSASCGGRDAHYGHVRIRQDASHALLTGRAGGSVSAAEIGPGCAGRVTAEPGHVLELVDPMKLTLRATSRRGPVAIVVASPDGSTVCDSDSGTGHAPHALVFERGVYRVWVASLTAGDPVPYELDCGPDVKREADPATEGTPGADAVSVTVTSTPPGAEVRTPTGQVLGVTPALFVYPLAPAEREQPLPFVIALPGHAPAPVSGRPVNGELVLAADLAPTGPPTPTGYRSSDPRPIRDFTQASQTVEVPVDCVISGIDVQTEIRHSYVADLRVTLRSPAGTTVTLHNHAGGSRANLRRTYEYANTRALTRLARENARGTWTMTVRDEAEIDIGTFDWFEIRLLCAGGSPAPSAASPATHAAIPSPRNTVLNPWAQTGTAANSPARPPALRAPPVRPGAEVLDPWH